jgi:hypothetical protein
MIHFFVNQAGSHGIQGYLADRGAALAGTVVPTEYEELSSLKKIRSCGAIFAATDQLGPAEQSAAEEVYTLLAARGNRVLNEPAGVLNRYALLKLLHDQRVNRFRAVRATERFDDLTYPVFVREEHRHTGTVSPLLADAFAVERALATLALQGRPRDQLLVVEFCDTRGPDGLYRKYSAFRVDGRILPRHVHVSARWVSKSGTSLVNPDTIREEARYFDGNPHEAWLRHIFELARIEYGRIDYGVANGDLQVWEINTNPTLGRNASRAPRPESAAYRPLTEPIRLQFHTAFQKAILELNAPLASPDLPVVLTADVLRRIAAERKLRRRRLRRKEFARKVLALTAVQRMRGILDPVAVAVTGHLARRRLSRQP